MVLRTRSEIIASTKKSLTDNSPQIRIDVNKGPFFYLAIEAVSTPLANASADVERLALLSTLQFPAIATDAEALATARAFGLPLGTGGYSTGIAYVYTTSRPSGSATYTVSEGDQFSTSDVGGQVFEALETRSLTDSNADAFYNPSSRRYEIPVLVQAVAAGTGANIAARTLTQIVSGANDFTGVVNLTAFSGGTESETISGLYARTQQRMIGLDNFSRGGLLARVQNVDTERVLAAAMTYSTEYPDLFYRLPDSQAIDVWILNTTRSTQTTETFVASAGQTQFYLSNRPALSLSTVLVNGAAVSGQLILDEALELGRSTRESSYVSLTNPVAVDDIVDITYTYDSVLNSIQAEIDGYYQADTGAMFATDVLCRYPKTTEVVVNITGTVLGTFNPTTVETEIQTVVGNYIANGLASAPLLGGTRSPAELRDTIRAQVPGVAGLNIPVFARRSVAPLVETIDIPRHSRIAFASTDDLTVTFT